MNCLNCRKANPTDGVFCIFCGSPLSLATRDTGGLPQQLERGASESFNVEAIHQVEQVIYGLTRRVELLENLLRESRSPKIAEISDTSMSGTHESVYSLRTEVEKHGPYSRKMGRVPGIDIPGQDEAIQSKSSGIDWESILGRNWLAIAGAVSLAVGVGFFLRLAFDNQWIGEMGRVILGIASGLILLGIGQYAHRRYPMWAQAVTGGGIAVLYLSVYAAFGFYQFLDPVVAFLCLSMVIILGVALALRYESRVISVLGFAGAFLTPILLSSDLTNSQHLLLIPYVLLVDVGIVAVSTVRNWRWLTLVGLTGSYFTIALFLITHSEGMDERVLQIELALTAIFVMFVGVTTLFHFIWRNIPGVRDLSLMLLNATLYFAFSLNVLWEQFRAELGLFTLGLAVFYGVLSYVSVRRRGVPSHMGLFSFILALTFLTLAIPLQFIDSWITLAWIIEGGVIVWVAFQLSNWRIRTLGLCVLAAGIVRLVIIDSAVEIAQFISILNPRFLLFFAAISVISISAYLFRKYQETLEIWELRVFVALVVIANVLAFWILTAEVDSYISTRELLTGNLLDGARHLSITILWAGYAIGLIAAGIYRRTSALRLSGLILLALPVGKLFTHDLFLLDHGYRVGAFVTLGVLLLSTGLVYQRYSQAIRGFLFGKLS